MTVWPSSPVTGPEGAFTSCASHHMAGHMKMVLRSLRELFTGKDARQMGKSHFSVLSTRM